MGLEPIRPSLNVYVCLGQGMAAGRAFWVAGFAGEHVVFPFKILDRFLLTTALMIDGVGKVF